MNARRRLLLSAVAGALVAAAPFGGAQERGRIPLNSERIEQRFGSYGIEVLESTAALRVSDLYSGSGARALALVADEM